MVDASEIMWQRRYELLLLLKACIADLNSENFTQRACFLITTDTRVELLVYSLINSLVKFNPYGFLSLPYASYARSVYKENAIKVGLQVIALLSLCDSLDEIEKTISESSVVRDNKVKDFFKSKKDRADLVLIWNSIKEVLNCMHIVGNTYLPGSQKPYRLEGEILLLFFLFIKENEGFLNLVVSETSCISILMPLLHLLLQQPTPFIVNLCVFIITKLSENRRFCVLLNTPLEQCSLDLPLFTGNHGDLLINAFTKLIFSKNSVFEPFFSQMLSIISNFSCYLKFLSSLSSHNILKLLQEFSVRYLGTLSEIEQNLIEILFETINSFAQYQ